MLVDEEAKKKKSNFFHVLLGHLTALSASTLPPELILKFNFGCAGLLNEGGFSSRFLDSRVGAL